MRPPFPGGETVVLHRRSPSGYDDYGNVTYTDSSTTITGVAIWPESATEVIQNAERTRSVYVALFPANVDIQAIDHLTWRDQDWEIQGDPELLRSPLTAKTLQTIRMVHVEG